MVSAADYPSSSILKLIYIGSSGTGKTGSLASLVKAGYKLKILDLDVGLDALINFVKRDAPDKLANIDYESRRDKYRATAAGLVCDKPTAFVDSLKLMQKWSDESDPSQWGPDTIFVVDSGSSFGKAAFEWARGMNPTSKDPRQWYAAAQKAFEDTLALLTSEAFNCNVIFISHVSLVELADGTTKGYANAIGKALGPVIPRYFNTMILAESIGTGDNVKRKIKTAPTNLIDLKNPAPFKIEASYPLETGLATLFEQLKGK